MRRSRRVRFQSNREAHVLQFLLMYGPATYAELMEAVPGDIGGRADRVARRLIREGRLEERFIKDYDETSS